MRNCTNRLVAMLLTVVLLSTCGLPEIVALATESETGPIGLSTVTVTFEDGVDHAVIGEPVSVVSGAELPTENWPAAPMHDGYTFTGWSVAALDRVTEDTTVTAQYQQAVRGTPEPVYHTVTFRLHDGSQWSDGNVTYAYQVEDGEAFSPSAWPAGHPDLDDNRFVSWSYGPADPALACVTADVDIYPLYAPLAQFSIQVDFQDEVTGEARGQSFNRVVYEGRPYAGEAVPVPYIAGYAAYAVDAGGNRVEIATSEGNPGSFAVPAVPEGVRQDYCYTVYYKGRTDVPYTVRHLWQTWKNGKLEYSEHESEQMNNGTPGLRVELAALRKDYASFGYKPGRVESEIPAIASDGKTEILIYYDLETVSILFDSNGGTPVEAVTGLVGQDVSEKILSIKNKLPTRAGWSLDCWATVDDAGNVVKRYGNNELPTTIPAKRLKLVAQWKPGTASFSVQYWLQDADDLSLYAYDSSKGPFQGAATGSTAEQVFAYYNQRVDNRQKPSFDYFHQNSAKYEIVNNDGTATLKGDGTSVLRVYFDRNEYTFSFDPGKEWVSTGWFSGYNVYHSMVVGGETYSSTKPYTFKVRYMQNISSLWPISPVATLESGFRGWEDAGGTVNETKRIVATADLIANSSNGATSSFTAQYGGNTRFELHYWLETYDGTGTKVSWGQGSRKKTAFFEDSVEYGQQLTSTSGLFSKKDIKGFTFVFTESENRNGVTIQSFYYTRNKSKLIFNDQKSNLESFELFYQQPLTDYYNKAIAIPAQSIPAHQEFKGWYTTKTCVDGTEFNAANTPAMPNGDLVVYAKIGYVQYSVHLNPNDGSPAQTKKVDYGAAVELPALTRPGYTLVGWERTDIDGDRKGLYASGTPVYQETYLRAIWEAGANAPYTVRYVDEQGNDLRDADGNIATLQAEGVFGSTLTFTAKRFDEFFPRDVSKPLTLSNPLGNELTFVYRKAEKTRYWVEYWDVTDPANPVLFATPAPYSVETKLKSDTVRFKPVPGYTALKAQITLDLCYEDENTPEAQRKNVFRFEYKKNITQQYPYQIVTHLQELGGGYKTTATVDAKDYYGVIVTASRTPVTGFTLNTQLSNLSGKVDNTRVLVLNLYYDRNAYDYTVHYKARGSEEEVAPDLTGSGKYGQRLELLANSSNPNFTLEQGAASPVTLELTDGVNEYTFWYTQRTDTSVSVRFIDQQTGEDILTGFTTTTVNGGKPIKYGDTLAYNNLKLPSGVTDSIYNNVPKQITTANGAVYALDETGTPKNMTVTVAQGQPNALVFEYTTTRYAVTYDGNGKTGAPTDGNQYRQGDSVAVQSWTATDAEFYGWSTKQASAPFTTQQQLDAFFTAENPLYAAGASFAMPAKNVTLYAVWKRFTFTLTYHYDAADVTIDSALAPQDGAPIICAAGSSQTVNDGAGVTRPGYTLDYWYTKDADGKEHLRYGLGGYSATLSMSGDVELYAHWTATPYTVSYVYDEYPAGASADDRAKLDAALPAPATYTYGDTAASDIAVAAVPANPTALPIHFAANGWTTADATVTNGLFDLPASDVVFHGKWETNTWSVTYAAAAPVGETAPVAPVPATFAVGENVTRADAAAMALSGYTFSGWTTADATVAADGTFAMPDHDVAFTGSWVKNYPLTYATDSGYPAHVALPDPASQDVPAGRSGVVVASPQSVPSGYAFDGWLGSDGATYQPGETLTMPNAALTLTETLSAIDYTVTYRFNASAPSGADSVLPAQLTGMHIGDSFTAAAAPVLAGYTFGGWTTTDATLANGAFTMPAGDVVLIGSWTANDYRVRYTYDATAPAGAPALPTDDTVYHIGDSVSVAAVGSMTGYTFSGWTARPAVALANGAFVMPAGDVELVGSWKVNTYKVSYQYAGTAYAPSPLPALPAEATVAYGESVTVAQLPSIPAGYSILKGWETSDATVANGAFTMPARNVTLTANWGHLWYDVAYAYDAPAPAGAPALPVTLPYEFGQPVTLEAAPALAGYTFGGWTTADATIANNAFTMPAAPVTLTGSWTPIDYNVTYAYTGAVPANAPGVPAALTGKHVGDSVLAAQAPTLDGYIFSGWTASPAVTLANGAFTMPAESVAFTGSWTAIDYTVSYAYTGDVPNGATAAPAAQTGKHVGDSVDVSIAPTLEGYRFSGWTTADATVENGAFTMPARDVAFTGSWTPIDYTVTYRYTGDVPNGAALPATLRAKHIGDSISVEAAPALPGFVFSGWTASPAVTLANGAFTMPANSVVLTGSWTADVSALTITDVEKTYDGAPASVAVGGMLPGDEAQYRVAGETTWSDAPIARTDVSTTTVEARVRRAGLVVFGERDDGTGTARTASLIVKPRLLTLTAPSETTFRYDGQLKTLALDDSMITSGTLANGEQLTPAASVDATTGLPSNQRKDVGSNPVALDPAKTRILKADGTDSTGNYAVSWKPGMLTIGKGAATGATTSVTLTYDAQRHSPAQNADGTVLYPVFTAQEYDANGQLQTVTLSPSAYEYADSATATVWSPVAPTFTEHGTHTIYVRMQDNRFEAAPVAQTLIVEQRHVTVDVDDNQTAVYNKQPQSASGYTVEQANGNRGLLAGHSLTAALLNATRTEVGANPSVTVDVNNTAIVDTSNASVRDNYIIDPLPGDFTIVAATGATLTVGGYTGVYDAAAHGLGVPALLDANGDSIDASELVSLTYEWTDADGAHSQTAAPSFTNVYLVPDANGQMVEARIPVTVTAVTKNYGTLTNLPNTTLVSIRRKPATVALTTYSGVYDGQTHPVTVDATRTTGLLGKHRLGGQVETNAPIDVGVYSVGYENLTILDENGADVTANYTVQLNPGSATITARTVRFAIENRAGANAFVFDGAAHTLSASPLAAQSADEGFVTREGQTAPESFLPVLDAAATQTWVTGATTVKAIGYGQFANGAALGNYAPATADGAIEVLPRPVELTAPSDVTLTYDGTVHELAFDPATCAQTFDASANVGAVSGFDIRAGFLNDSNRRKLDGTQTVRLDPNSVQVTAAGQSLPSGVTAESQFAFTFADGTLTIARGQIPLTIVCDGLTRLYDGTAYTIPADAYRVSTGALANATSVLTARVSQAAPITHVGSVATNVKNVVIMDDGVDVTHNYALHTSAADVVVQPRPILFTVLDAAYPYDTTPKSTTAAVGPVAGVGGILPGLQLKSVLLNNSRIDVGSQPVAFDRANTFLTDAAGNPVDMNDFAVTWSDGTLTISQPSITYYVYYYYGGVLAGEETLTLAAPAGTVIDAFPASGRAGYRFDHAVGAPLTLSYGQSSPSISVYYVRRPLLELIVDVETPLSGSMLGVNVGDSID